LSKDRRFFARKYPIQFKHEMNKKRPLGRSSLPLSIEPISALFDNKPYDSRDLQPSMRGGLVWPGTDIFIYLPKRYYRPTLLNQDSINF